jgi:hypothetical protein
MTKRKQREGMSLSLSFLDAITCGFGAVILLLVIVKMFEPIRLEESDNELEGLIVRYQAELNELLGESDEIRRQRMDVESDVELDREQIAQLESELTRIRAAYLEQQDEATVASQLAGQLAQAKQSLTDEMERLLADYRPDPEDYVVGGIPVDSEYIVFIIDTSGSMRRYEWDRVQQQIQETLDVYPTVKGIQVLNDEGEHMFRSYRGDWIPDTPARRQAIVDALRNWNAFSNSSPREGILEAIETYWAPDKKISLYVYSDDFSQGSIAAVVREVDRRNQLDAEGNRRVRIHAVAFPVFWDVTGTMLTGANFAILMRALCQRNGGTFVALPSRRAG